MKPLLSFLLIVSVFIHSCKEKKDAGADNGKQVAVPSKQAPSGNIQGMLDSIRSFKPLQLSFSDAHSDVDALIPLGFNNHGTFAYLVDENSGGASGLKLGILPAYQDFSLESQLGMDEEKDTILLRNKELVYHALRSQGIRLVNAVQKSSADSLKKLYDIQFEIKKTWGAPNPDDPSGKKTLASVEINWKQGESLYPSFLYSEKHAVSHSIYDTYISDYILVPGEEGIFGFVVIVTESLGFEGYTRKSIEVKDIGVVKG